MERAKSSRCLSSLFIILALFILAKVVDAAEPSATIAKAKAERKVVLYSTQTESQSRDLLRAFEKKYPFIETSLYRAGTGGLLSKIITENQAGRNQTDVIQIGGFEAQVLKEKGLALRYVSPEAEFFPVGFKDPDGFWCDVFVNVGVMAYNKKLVPAQQAPKSYQDLLQPKWRGKISIDQEDAEWFGNILEVMGRERGVELARSLGEQDLIPRRGRRLQAQLLSAGEFPIALNLYVSSVAELIGMGAPIEIVAAEPLIAKLHPIFPARLAPHPNAAKLYIDFVLSEEGQRLIARTEIPSRKGVRAENAIVRRIQALKLYPSDPKLGKNYAEYKALFNQLVFRR